MVTTALITPGSVADADMIAAGLGRPNMPIGPTRRGFPTHGLHGLVGDVVNTLAPETEADPASLAVSFLTAFGSAVGPGPHATVGAAHHPARLNALIVGDTSRARKGTSWSEIARLMRLADGPWAEKRIASGLASGEGLIRALDEDSDDRRLLVVEPEFARVIAACGRDGSTLSAIIREAWDSGNLRVMTRKDPLSVAGAHVSIIGHITRQELRQKLCTTEAANGFANRFLFVAAHRAQLLPTGGNLDPHTLETLGRRVRDALQAARRVVHLRRSPAADTYWTEIYRQMAADPPGAAAATSRAEAQTLRLSVAYALTDGTGTIELDHLIAAYATWQYCEQSAVDIFGTTTGDLVADQLLTAIRSAGPLGLDGTGQNNVFSGHVPAQRIAAARAHLEGLGLIRTDQQTTGGRPRLTSYPKEV